MGREKAFCPARWQQPCLSAKLQSCRSPAPPVRSGHGSTGCLSQSPKTSRIKCLGAVQRLDPGLSTDCRQAVWRWQPCDTGHCSGAWAAPPGAPADLQHVFLPALINLLLSDLSGTNPCLIWERRCHLTRSFLVSLFHTSVWLCL